MIAIPKQWSRHEFGDIACLVKDKVSPSTLGDAHDCVELEHIESDTGRLLGSTSTLHTTSTKTPFRPGDVLFGKLRPYLRKYWLAVKDGVCSTEIWVLRPRNSAVSAGYLHLLVQTDFFQRWANMTTGSKMPRAEWDAVSEAPFPIPTAYEQQRIETIVGHANHEYQRTADLLDLKHRFRRGLMQQLMTGARPLPDIKYDWRECTLGDLFANRQERGRRGLPLMSVTMNDGLVERVTLDRKTDSELTPEQHLLIRKDDIAYNMMRMWQGACGLAHHDGIVSPAYIVVAPNHHVDPLFASYWFKSSRMLYLLWAYSYGLTGDRLRLYYKDFARIPVSVPSRDAQEAIAHILKGCDDEIALLKRQLEALKAQKKGLMQKLLTGQIRVTSKGA